MTAAEHGGMFADLGYCQRGGARQGQPDELDALER